MLYNHIVICYLSLYIHILNTKLVKLLILGGCTFIIMMNWFTYEVNNSVSHCLIKAVERFVNSYVTFGMVFRSCFMFPFWGKIKNDAKLCLTHHFLFQKQSRPFSKNVRKQFSVSNILSITLILEKLRNTLSRKL